MTKVFNLHYHTHVETTLNHPSALSRCYQGVELTDGDHLILNYEYVCELWRKY